MTSKTYKKLLGIMAALLLLITLSISLNAQPGPPSGGNGDETPGGSGGGAPISGGIGFLVAMGAGYGIMKYRKQRDGKS